MKKVLTYGTYDLLHYGHLALLKRAKEVGDYLIVGVTSDAFDKGRGKLNVKQSLVERIEAVKATGLADKIIVEEYEGQKISDILKYEVDVFTVGSDWIGKFDYLKEYCDVIYLSRTEGISSTEVRTGQNPIVKIGIWGLENPADRFVDESLFVSGSEVVAAYDENEQNLLEFCERHQINSCGMLDELLENVDAVYISQSINQHFECVMKCLGAGCHVLCECPAFMKYEEAAEAFCFAEERGLVLFEGLKTLFFPAFEHLLLLVNSGKIGAVRDIEVTATIIPGDFEEAKKNPYKGSLYDWGAIVLLPIIKMLGTDFLDCRLYSLNDGDGFNIYTKGILDYPNAMATFKAGKGIKAEGEMIITGDNGYIYIPAPWWKTEYFEIRYEDLRDTKKYFYQFDGEGLRYEILEFVKMINQGEIENYHYTRDEISASAKILEMYAQGKYRLIKY